MSDPYKILGISRDATDDEVKKAYRQLSRKYHPDANINNPNKDQAEEMFKQVQQAYQQIIYEREHPYANSSQSSSTGGYGSAGSGSGGYAGYGSYGDFWGDFGDFWSAFGGYGGYGGAGYGGRSQSQGTEDEQTIYLRAAANYINNGRYQEALNVLNSIADRTAVWYYYSALSNAGLGNNVLALQHAQKAAQMEPSNVNYQQLVSSLQSGSTWYQSRQNPYGSTISDQSGLCLKLCLANLVCNMLCGGGGMCCGAPYYGGVYHC